MACSLFVASSACAEITQVVAWGGNEYGQCDVPPDLTNAVAVSAGAFHSLALKADGTVVSWGSVGHGGRVPAGLSNVVALSGGYFHNLAVRSDGTAAGWGNNSSGQATIPAGLTDVAAVSAGAGHSLLLRSNGTVIAWGDNWVGQTNVPANLTARAIAASPGANMHSLAVTTGRTVASWGYFGQSSVPGWLGNVVAVEAGEKFDLALRSDGRVIAWGNWTDFGETNVPPDLTNAAAITSGSYHSLAIRSNGNVVAWGANWYGQTNIPLGVTNVLGIAAGQYHSLVLIPGGAPFIGKHLTNITAFSGTEPTFSAQIHGVKPLSYQWQRNGAEMPGETNASLTLHNVQTGDAAEYRLTVSNNFGTATTSATLSVIEVPAFIVFHPTNQAVPRGATATFRVIADGSRPISCQWRRDGVDIPGATNTTLVLNHVQFPESGVYAVAVSNSFGGVISSNATLRVLRVVVWGDNRSGQANVPFELTNAVALSGGQDYAAALNPDGTLVAWGSNIYGQTDIPAGTAGVIALAPRAYRTGLALKSDRSIVSWGDNSFGQRNVLANLSGVVAVAGGAQHSLALQDDGRVAAWGGNSYGQTNVPTSASNIVAVAAGGYHSLALKRDGSVVAWGDNTVGQGSVPMRYIGGGYAPIVSNVVAIASGGFNNLVLKRDGRLFAWGSDYDGQTTIPAPATNIVAIASGGNHCLALRNDGTVLGWGSASYGQRLVPANLTNVIGIAAGDQFSMALIGDGSPVVTVEPRDTSVPAGSNTVLYAMAVGTPAPTYQWQFNGTDIPGATNSLLEFFNVPATKAGSYRCVVTNAFGAAASRWAQLTVTRTALPGFDLSPGKLVLTNSGFQMRLTGLAGAGKVVVYASSNLFQWQSILTNPPYIGSLTVTDAAATNYPMRFYRVVEEP